MRPFSFFLSRARARRGHPRLVCSACASKAWVAGASPATTRWICRGQLPSVSLALIAALAITVAARAAEAPAPPPCPDCAVERTLPSADIVPDAPASRPVPPSDPAVQAHLPGCAVWTDRCVNCQRDAGKITCSNIGIACQPQAVECLRPEPAEQKSGKN